MSKQMSNQQANSIAITTETELSSRGVVGVEVLPTVTDPREEGDDNVNGRPLGLFAEKRATALATKPDAPVPAVATVSAFGVLCCSMPLPLLTGRCARSLLGVSAIDCF